MISPYLLAVSVLLAAVVLRLINQRLRAHSIAHLPGPLAGSWLVGNYPALLRPDNVGDADFEWMKRFGNTIRIKGTFGSDLLFTADPKSLKHILNTSGYAFQKSPEIRAVMSLITGKGIVWVEGERHSWHRKIMNPAFSYKSLRLMLPLFRQTAQNAVTKWKDLVMLSGNTSSVIDIPPWLARTTLDAVGAAAFDYQFGALDEGTNNELSQAYFNLFADMYHNPPDSTIAFQILWGYVPEWLIRVFQNTPTRQVKRLRSYMSVARRVARALVDRQIQLYSSGKEGGKDILSILVRANLTEDPRRKLGDDEILSQLTTLMLAAHETTASTVTWALYELSKHKEFQNELREEIKARRSQVLDRGDHELSTTDLDSMKKLLALIKETLRYHPVIPSLTRVASCDDVIPLSTPQRTSTGETIHGIHISKGQRVILSIAGYNRVKSVWGDDADVWRPQRFLEGVETGQETGLGVFANIITFSSGVRSCIGWRFAVIQMQAILAEFIENFDFSPPPGNIEITRAATTLMSPMIKGQNSGRTELPLMVTPVI